jgi:hypothetical protein
MNADNMRQKAGRWMRVGVLTLTTFGPIINVAASRFRERTRKLQQNAVKRGQETLAQSQGQLLTVGASLSDTLAELKDNPYSQELLKRGSELAGTLAEQGGKLSHDLAERSSRATQVVVERGSGIARDLTERGNKATQEIAKQSQRTTREVSLRTQRAAQQAQRELIRASSQVRTQATSPDYAARFWSIFGFIVGLTSAIAGAYLLIKRRFQPNTPVDEPVQLSNHAMLNGASSMVNKVSATRLNTPTASSASVATSPPSPPSIAPTAPTTSPTSVVTSAQESQDIQDVQDIPVLPDTLPENAPSLTATAEPLTASPESGSVVSTSHADALPVEVPVEAAITPSQDMQEAAETQATDMGTPPATFNTVETPTGTGHSYEMGDEASAVSTGMPTVSVDETVIPMESLGTATVSGFESDDESPTVKQEAVSNALASTIDKTLNTQASQAQASAVAGPAILGVVSTKRYYSVETPLSDLRPPDGDELDIIYFANEDEAKAQGYSIG